MENKVYVFDDGVYGCCIVVETSLEAAIEKMKNLRYNMTDSDISMIEEYPIEGFTHVNFGDL